MNITIHRGANQIGGCITEISSDNCKLLIDFGSNLPGNQKAELTENRFVILQEVPMRFSIPIIMETMLVCTT